MNQVWTEVERKFVQDNASILTDQQGSEQLSAISGRKITLYAYRKQRQKLNIVKGQGRGVCKVDKDKTTAKGGRIADVSKLASGVDAKSERPEQNQGTDGGEQTDSTSSNPSPDVAVEVSQP